MTDSEFDKLFEEAILEYGGDYVEIPKQMWIPHWFSRSFRRRMREMIDRQWSKQNQTYTPPQPCVPSQPVAQRPRVHYKSLKFCLRYMIAVFVAAFSSAVFLVVGGAGSADDEIEGFKAERHPAYTKIWTIHSENTSTLVTDWDYAPTYVPEGYILTTDSFPGYSGRRMTFESLDGSGEYTFEQHSLYFSCSHDSEDAEVLPLEINGYPGLKIIKPSEHWTDFFWNTGEYVFWVSVHSVDLSYEEIEKIAFSVQKIESR